MSETPPEGGGSGRSAKACVQCVQAWGRACGLREQCVQKQGGRKHPGAFGHEHVWQ